MATRLPLEVVDSISANLEDGGEEMFDEHHMTNLAGNMVSLPVQLACMTSLFASLSWTPLPTATAEEAQSAAAPPQASGGSARPRKLGLLTLSLGAAGID